MTALQEAAMRKALEALETCSYGDYSAKHVVDPSFDGDAVEAAIESLKAALAQQELPQKERPDFMAGYDAGMADAKRMAQQGEQQPVAWYEYNQDLDAWFLAYGHNPKAKTRPLVFGDTAAPAPQAQQMEPTDDQLVKGVKAMRLFVTKNSVADFKLGYMAALAAAPAPQARTIAQRNVAVVSMFDTQQTAQDVPETNFGNMQPKFLANGTRFKLSFDTRGKVSSLWNFMDELDGRWVALVAAEDDCHLQSAQPVAQPLSDSEIEKLREKTFSTYNPYCPVDSKSMRKAVRAAEAAHGIGEVK